MNDNILYKNIKKYRLERKLSQAKLAELTGYTDRSSIAKIEKGVVDLSQSKIKAFADVFNISPSELMGFNEDQENKIERPTKYQTYECVKIPILGRVAAGIPIDAIENIIGYEDIPTAWAKYDEYFALKIKGDSMLPDICDGDIVVVRVQPVVDNGQIAIVCINGETATCKRVMRYEKELCLVSINPAYETMRFTPDEVNNLPVTVLGRVIEIRRKL